MQPVTHMDDLQLDICFPDMQMPSIPLGLLFFWPIMLISDAQGHISHRAFPFWSLIFTKPVAIKLQNSIFCNSPLPKHFGCLRQHYIKYSFCHDKGCLKQLVRLKSGMWVSTTHNISQTLKLSLLEQLRACRWKCSVIPRYISIHLPIVVRL